MGMLIGAVLMTVIVVGTAALTGHPLDLIVLGLLTGGAVFLATSRGRRLALRRRR